MTKKKQKGRFNYAVGHYWDDQKGAIGCYTLFSEVHYGTLEEAVSFLKYVKKKSPEHDWKVFTMAEVPV